MFFRRLPSLRPGLYLEYCGVGKGMEAGSWRLEYEGKSLHSLWVSYSPGLFGRWDGLLKSFEFSSPSPRSSLHLLSTVYYLQNNVCPTVCSAKLSLATFRVIKFTKTIARWRSWI